MPELPEVETIKNIIGPQIKGLTIEKVTVNCPQVIAQPSSGQFCEAVAGRDIRYDAPGKVFNYPFEKWEPDHPTFANDRLFTCNAAQLSNEKAHACCYGFR